ncbi:unnamed protein product [Mytilus edulis]|uniref:Uncharacterized protein n=1 Tax=Mytilus edulis TaxID=6550 RepID=A0A8S3PV30_MYTED|nr:unnamed protein product [Mytilus edulis]
MYKAETINLIRTLVVNFQRIRNKVPDTQVLVLIDNADPDMIVGTETWLNSEIVSPEVLPNNYNVFRRDRDDYHGGYCLGSLPASTNPTTDLQGELFFSMEPNCVTKMTQQLGWEPLEHRRARSRVIMFYKIINYIVEVPVHHLLSHHDTRTRGSVSNNIRQIRIQTGLL